MLIQSFKILNEINHLKRFKGAWKFVSHQIFTSEPKVSPLVNSGQDECWNFQNCQTSWSFLVSESVSLITHVMIEAIKSIECYEPSGSQTIVIRYLEIHLLEEFARQKRTCPLKPPTSYYPSVTYDCKIPF